MLFTAITAKLEDENVHAATCPLCDSDHQMELTAESFTNLQEKHPLNTYLEEMRCLPIPTTITTCIKFTELDVAIKSFPKVLAGGPRQLMTSTSV